MPKLLQQCVHLAEVCCEESPLLHVGHVELGNLGISRTAAYILVQGFPLMAWPWTVY